MVTTRPHAGIAIIGLSGRFPGAGSVEDYWKNLCDGAESITFFSDTELLASGVDPSLVANPNYVKAAPMLPDVETFDASFFGYSPKDAALMDPQQRLFLEVCWEAFENAGYDPARYPGQVGVLSAAGGVVSSYLLAKLDHEDLPGQTASISHINNDKDFLATRVAFKLNLRGPSFTIASACSSSLVAVHQACQNLCFNECDMMLVGGSVVRIPQIEGYLAEKRNLHSLDGHCRPFDAVGQGTIFGSGVGAALLKPLNKAVSDRDHIYAVIIGTAANNDGSSKTSYTAPSLGQQSQAVADALRIAGASADSVGYIECHSTGTIVGDPLEIEALTMAFRKGTDRKQYCAIGSVKANIGHPEQAAGIAGLIKTALVLHHKKIPPNINYDTPNPAIDFVSSPFYVNTNLTDFAATGGPRRAGLNSLGIGGTNVFAVLEEAPVETAEEQLGDPRPYLVTLSAKNAEALIARVRQLQNWLNDNPDASIGDLCYTTNVSRSQFAFRFAMLASSVAELKSRLAAWLQNTANDAASLKQTERAPIAFMFSGQGSQYAGMAEELYRTHPVFHDALDRCDALARPQLERGLIDIIFARNADVELVNRTEYTQPALFSVEYALIELLKSWGVRPDAVIGHSLGEIAAACAANVMSLEDAMRLAVARGALMQSLPGGGAMISIMAQDSVVKPLIDQIAPEIAIAAMNGPLNTVVSGDRDPLKRLTEDLDRCGIAHRELRISNGFHSPRTEPILDDLENVAAQIRHSPPEVTLISNLTGDVMSVAPDKSYWRRHMREGVRFGDGMLALSRQGYRSFLEVGPHTVLLPMAQACLQATGKSATWIATLNRKQSDASSISEMLAALYLAGHNVDWAAVHAGARWRRVPLPTYPFQRKRHWLDTAPTGQRVRQPATETLHPLLGKPVRKSPEEMHFETRYGAQHPKYLSDHRVAGTIVLPTTVELEAATALGRRFFGTAHVSFDHAMHHQAMSFANGEDRIVCVSARFLNTGRANFKIESATIEKPDVWHTHMTGTLRKAEAPSGPAVSVSEVRTRCPKAVLVSELYDVLARLGLEYGPSFRGVRELYVGQHEALTRVELPQGLTTTQYIIHPAILDACMHAYPLVIDQGAGAKSESGERRSFLPVSLEGYRCYMDGIDRAWVHTRLRAVENDGTRLIDIHAYDDAGRLVVDLEGLAVRLLPLDKVSRPHAGAEPSFYRVAWRKSERAKAVSRQSGPASWLIFADAKGVGAALATRLEAAGHRCHLVYRGDALTRQDPRIWTLNERQPQDFRLLLEQIAAVEPLACEGVVYLWGLDAPSMEGLTLAKLKNGCEMICSGALAILHALSQTRVNVAARRSLWFVTANSQGFGGSQDVDPLQSPLWGLGRTIAIEYPALWGGLIDLHLNGRSPDIDSLMTELLCPDGETQIAISAHGERHVARLARQPLDELPQLPTPVFGDATYLITGGLGMLGRSVVEWLIAKGARHLVLTGRSAAAKDVREIFSATELKRASIHVTACDVSREEDVARLIAWISKELPALRGVVHSAGVLDDGILAQMNWDRFARLFEPRVYGSWLLHQYTRSMGLDFFVFQSSLLSLLGSAGQGNYTASSAFLDSLVAHRRAADLPARSVNWCAWSGGGLATVSGARGEVMWASLGHEFISPDVATRAFDKLMHCDLDQIAIAAADWTTYAGRLVHAGFLAELTNGAAPQVSHARMATIDSAVRAANGHARAQFLGRLQNHIATKLGFTELIEPDQRLNDLGVDSLMSVSLSNSLESEFGIPVPVAEIIKGPTINELVDGVFAEFIQTLSLEDNHAVSNGHPTPPVLTDAQLDKRSATNGAATFEIVRLNGGLSPAAHPPLTSSNGDSHSQNGAANSFDRGRLSAHLQRSIMEELGFAEAIDPDLKLNDVGLDSLRSVSLSNKLEKDFGTPVPIAELIAGPTINQLADFLTSEFVKLRQDQIALIRAAISPHRSVTLSGGAETVSDAPTPVMVYGVSRTTGATGLNIRLGDDYSHSDKESRRLDLRATGHIANSFVARNGASDDADKPVASGLASNGNGDEQHALVRDDRKSEEASRHSGKWLIAPQPNPNAAVRLFCFPYAGGGVASFRAWPQLAHGSMEIVAVEPPGRGTRINESAVEDLDTFVQRLLPELIKWLDRPSAFFGHCLGGLTMFATLCALPEAYVHYIKYAFACGVRPPHLLRRKGAFEDDLAYRMMLHQDFDIRIAPYAQSDDLFSDIIRQFDTPAADRMLAIPKLRKLLLPAIRAEFGMAYNYRYQFVAPFRFPIASFVGASDPWVSQEHSAGWGDLTRGTFTNHVRKGSHFLMVDDQDYILKTIANDFVNPALL